MQEIMINYYPMVIRQIEEIRQIARAEDIEFAKLKALTAETASNMFISTANQEGISKFEQLFGIVPKAAQSLEERRTAVIFRTNQRKMSLTELKTMLSEYFPEVEFFMDMDRLWLKISVNIDSGNIELIRDMADEILPLNIFFINGYHDSFVAAVHYENAICIRMEFYPRFNLPRLSLNGAWKLDGSQMLSGYDGAGNVDFYPIRARFRSKAESVLHGGCRISLPAKAQEQAESRLGITIRDSVPMQEMAKKRVTIKIAAEVKPAAGDVIVHNQNVLDNVWKLNGSRKLNGGADLL